MPGTSIVVPQDRAMNQPVTGFCRNPECRSPHPFIPDQTLEFNFPVEHDHCECPKCGANRSPMIGTLTLTHLLIPDKDGPVKGAGGTRWRIACDSKRAYLATVTNDEAATDNVEIANCPGCIAAAVALKVNGVDKNLRSGVDPKRPKYTTVPTIDGRPAKASKTTKPPPKQVITDDS